MLFILSPIVNVFTCEWRWERPAGSAGLLVTVTDSRLCKMCVTDNEKITGPLFLSLLHGVFTRTPPATKKFKTFF